MLHLIGSVEISSELMLIIADTYEIVQDELLISDDLFVEYFNAFLSLPVSKLGRNWRM